MGELKKIVVCGATGKQGGAVLDALVNSGKWELITFSRNPDGPQARKIAERGVTVLKGDFLDRDSLNEIFKGAYGVYGVTMPVTPKGKIDTEIEWQQGQNIVKACLSNNIKHLVLSSVLYVEEGQENTLSYVKRKIDIENLVKSSKIPYTFLCPASFMDEFGGEFLPVKNGTITGMAFNDAKLPYIACKDIGKFASLAFDNPEVYIGQKLNLIGDFISGNELAAIASKLSSSKTYKHKAPPIFLMYLFAKEWIPLRKHFEKWGQLPYPDKMVKGISETRNLMPDVLTFENYLKKEGWDKKL